MLLFFFSHLVAAIVLLATTIIQLDNYLWKPERDAADQVWKDQGCYLYDTECGKHGQNVCTFKAPMPVPFFSGNRLYKPYPSCTPKK
jgi:hypothetical protein